MHSLTLKVLYLKFTKLFLNQNNLLTLKHLSQELKLADFLQHAPSALMQAGCCVGAVRQVTPGNSADPDFAPTTGEVHAAPEGFLRALAFHHFDAAGRACRRLVVADGDGAVQPPGSTPAAPDPFSRQNHFQN